MLEQDFIKILSATTKQQTLELVRFFNTEKNQMAVKLASYKLEVWDQTISSISEI